MKEMFDERYEGIYEKEYGVMEMGEKLDGILECLEGIGDCLVKLLGAFEERGKAEAEVAKEKEKVKKKGDFKVGVGLDGCDGGDLSGKGQLGEIARIFGNL